MGIEFQLKEEWFQFFDNQGNSIERKTEVRFDPLTNETSRIVFDPGLALTPPDYTEQGKQTEGKNCPFCEENLLKMTPVLPKELAEEGRITQGTATLFPNLFPYSKYNGVVIFSNQHYVRLEEFTEEMMKDALMVAQTFIQRVMAYDEDVKYASINWNYLPYSGGSILHPHMHIIVSDSPTNNQALVTESANTYKKQHGEDYFQALCRAEKENGERWIGETGKVAWMTAFSPKSHNDFLAIMPNITSIDQITDDVWTDFAKGLKGVFATLNEQGFASFNMAMSFGREREASIHAHLIPRLTLGQLDTSDMNYFQTLHQEPLSYKAPEDIAAKAREHFQK